MRKIGRELILILLFSLIFVLGFLFFFPQFYSSIDEHSYLKNSLQIQRGFLGEKDPLKACRASTFTQNGYIAVQFIGRSLFLIPFTWFGLNAVMLSGLIIHLLNFFLLFLILKKLKIRAFFALLYLFFPPMVWAARTLYASPLVLACLLGAFYFYLDEKRKNWFFSGLFFGLAVLVRYDAALAFGAFFLASLLKKRNKSLFLLAGFIPIFLAIMLFNQFTYGGVLSTGYGSSMGVFASVISLTPFDLLVPAMILSLAYPAMIFSPYLSKKKVFALEFLFLTLSYFVYLSSITYFFSLDFSLIKIFTIRLRYFIPFIGLLLIPYSIFLNELLDRFKERQRVINTAFFSFIAILAIVSIVEMQIHSDFLTERKIVFDQIYSKTPENALIIGSSDDCMYFLKGFFPERRYLNVELGQELAGNPENLSLEQFLDSKTHVMNLHYSNRKDRESGRQQIIKRERKKLLKFIEENKDKLELVFETSKPHYLEIYRYIGETSK